MDMLSRYEYQKLTSVIWFARHLDLLTKLSATKPLPLWRKQPVLLIAYDAYVSNASSPVVVVIKAANDQVPPFPADIISGLAGRYVAAYHGKIEVSDEFFFLSYLACMGSILSGRITLDSEIAPQPRLYLLLLGESADDRKSTAMKKTVDFFQSTFGNQFHAMFGVGSAEGLQKRIKATPRVIFVLDEFKQFVSKSCIDSSVLLPCVTTLFESNRYENATAKNHVIIEDGHLSILAASTLETFKRAYDSSFTDIGFTNRIFLVPGRSSIRVPIPPKLPDKAWQDLSAELYQSVQQIVQNAPITLPLTADALALYNSWYINMPRSVHTKRLDVYALRFMILFAVNDGKLQIDVETVRKVIQLMNWQLEVRKQLDPIDADNQAARMEESIRRALRKGEMTERNLKIRVNAERAGLWIFKMSLQNLMDADDVKQRLGRTKKSTVYMLTEPDEQSVVTSVVNG